MIVIADDITGAAELAGIAYHKGLPVALHCAFDGAQEVVPDGSPSGTSVWVIATDTRSMTESEAISETSRIATSHTISYLLSLSKEDASRNTFATLLFKKTDSALRGHVVAELSTLIKASRYQRAVYLPANPSKGRIIKDCTYLIDNKPIHQTAFSYDPEFPATTSNLQMRFPDAAAQHIIMPDACSAADIRQVVSEYNDGHTLFAGAADLFSALLEAFHDDRQEKHHKEQPKAIDDSSVIILRGSTQSQHLDLGIPVADMPRMLYDGNSDIDSWDTSAYAAHHRIILAIPHNHRTGKEVAIHLRTLMARKTRMLVDEYRPQHLIIEGGATAWATLKVLGWQHFEITRQIAPGVVEMRAENGTLVTLKPGSYPWGEMLQEMTTTIH
ncbi:MAG: hypothetical protein IJ637_03935 [Prevotella sp.]|nr:hypothetical protein [Prevotella sp.]